MAVALNKKNYCRVYNTLTPKEIELGYATIERFGLISGMNHDDSRELIRLWLPLLSSLTETVLQERDEIEKALVKVSQGMTSASVNFTAIVLPVTRRLFSRGFFTTPELFVDVVNDFKSFSLAANGLSGQTLLKINDKLKIPPGDFPVDMEAEMTCFFCDFVEAKYRF